MDFNHMKLFANHSLRQEMPTAKYYTSSRYSNDSKLYTSKLEGIPNHLINLSSQITSSKQFTNPNFNDQKLNNQILMPAMLSLKNIFFETFATKGSTADVTKMHLISETRTIVNNQYNNNNSNKKNKDYRHISEILKTNSANHNFSNIQETNNSTDQTQSPSARSLSPRRYDNNLQLKVKQIKKSPNTMFYRNLIEEISERKIPSMKNNSPVEDIEEYMLIQNPQNSLFNYEIRYSEAKRKKPVFHSHEKSHYTSEMDIIHGEQSKKNDIKKMVLEPKIPKYWNEIDDMDESNTQHSISDADSEDSFIIFNNSKSCTSHAVDGDQRTRQRYASDCDSEDSFIIFDDSSTLDDEEHDHDIDKNCVSSANRIRRVSDCDSEDSFIMFAEEVEDDDHDEEDYREQIDYIWGSEEEEESDDESDTDDVDEPDFSSGLAYQKVCGNAKVNAIPKKVQFKPDSELEIVHPMIAWNYAYHNARKGPWEEAARDRSRFQLRMRRIHDIIKPTLTPEHRIRVYSERFQ